MICCALLSAIAVACGDEFPDTPCPNGTEQDLNTGYCIETVTVIEYRDPEPEPFPCNNGQVLNGPGECISMPVDEPFPCKANELETADGDCIPMPEEWAFPCENGKVLTSDGTCIEYRRCDSPSSPEVCNNFDDDCDGVIDNDCQPVVMAGSLNAQIARTMVGSPDSRIILGNSANVPAAFFRLSALDDAILVQKLTLSNCITAVPDTDGDCADPGETPGDDSIAAMVRISYQNEAGTTVGDTGFLSQGSVSFNNLDVWVPASGTTDVKFMIDTNGVSADGTVSGSQIQLNLNAVAGNGSFRAVGTISGATLTERDLNTYVVSNPMVIRRTQPTVSLASGTPSGAGVPGLSEVFRFNITADARGYLLMHQILFKLISSDGANTGWNGCDAIGLPTKWELYDAADPSRKLDDAGDWSFYTASGTPCSSGEVLSLAVLTLRADPTTPSEEIRAGETKTYVPRFESYGASSSQDDAIRIDLPDTGFPYDINFRWGDGTVAGSDIGSEYIRNLPITGGTIVY